VTAATRADLERLLPEWVGVDPRVGKDMILYAFDADLLGRVTVHRSGALRFDGPFFVGTVKCEAVADDGVSDGVDLVADELARRDVVWLPVFTGYVEELLADPASGVTARVEGGVDLMISAPWIRPTTAEERAAESVKRTLAEWLVARNEHGVGELCPRCAKGRTSDRRTGFCANCADELRVEREDALERRKAGKRAWWERSGEAWRQQRKAAAMPTAAAESEVRPMQTAHPWRAPRAEVVEAP